MTRAFVAAYNSITVGDAFVPIDPRLHGAIRQLAARGVPHPKIARFFATTTEQLHALIGDSLKQPRVLPALPQPLR